MRVDYAILFVSSLASVTSTENPSFYLMHTLLNNVWLKLVLCCYTLLLHLLCSLMQQIMLIIWQGLPS